MTTGKTIVSILWNFVGKMKSLLFNFLSLGLSLLSFQRPNVFLMSWLQSTFAVILDPKKIKSVTASTFSSSICHEVMGP